MNKNGFSLILVVFIVGILFLLGTTALRIVFNSNSTVHSQYDNLSALYSAEAAIEYGKAEQIKNAAWYTDNTHHGDIIEWLRHQAVGKNINTFSKVVKENKSNILYGVGVSNKACVIIKLENGYFEEL